MGFILLEAEQKQACTHQMIFTLLSLLINPKTTTIWLWTSLSIPRSQPSLNKLMSLREQLRPIQQTHHR